MLNQNDLYILNPIVSAAAISDRLTNQPEEYSDQSLQMCCAYSRRMFEFGGGQNRYIKIQISHKDSTFEEWQTTMEKKKKAITRKLFRTIKVMLK